MDRHGPPLSDLRFFQPGDRSAATNRAFLASFHNVSLESSWVFGDGFEVFVVHSRNYFLRSSLLNAALICQVDLLSEKDVSKYFSLSFKIGVSMAPLLRFRRWSGRTTGGTFELNLKSPRLYFKQAKEEALLRRKKYCSAVTAQRGAAQPRECAADPPAQGSLASSTDLSVPYLL